jgi:protein-disulfide isomerase
MKKVLRSLPMVALPLALLLPLRAEEPMTRQQGDAILQELRQIRQLLEKQQAAAPQKAEQEQRAKVSLTDRPFLGNKDAPITMVEYTDYQCPFCRQFHITSFEELKKNYIDTGKVRFYSKDLPLDFHANALKAAQAARCAGEQGQFWKLRDTMSTNADKLQTENIIAWAKDLKMDTSALQACIDSGKYKNAVQGDVMEAMKIGANGTPSFILGKSTPDGVDGELIVGAMPYAVFDQKLKDLGTAH